MAEYIDVDMVEYLIDHYGGMVTWNKKEILGEIRKQVRIHSTEDVVPRSEVEVLQEENANLKKALRVELKTVESLSKSNQDLVKAKQEVAKHIFEEIENIWYTTFYDSEFEKRLVELEKKYIGE